MNDNGYLSDLLGRILTMIKLTQIKFRNHGHKGYKNRRGIYKSLEKT